MLLRCSPAGLNHWSWEGLHCDAGAFQPPQRCWILDVVAREHPVGGRLACLLQDRLVAIRELLPLLVIYEKVQHGAAFPPAGAVVVLRDSVEAEFLIVIGADELCRIERSALECREHLIGRHLLWLDPKPGEDLPAHATNSELEPAQIIDTSNLFAEPRSEERR